MRLIISILCTVFLLSGPAFAQKAPSKRTPAKATKKPAKKATPKAKKANKASAKKAKRCKRNETRTAKGCVRVKDVDFQKGDEIGGETPTGYGEIITGGRDVSFAGLIRLRTHFHDKILKSAESL